MRTRVTLLAGARLFDHSGQDSHKWFCVVQCGMSRAEPVVVSDERIQTEVSSSLVRATLRQKNAGNTQEMQGVLLQVRS